jgi:hypothetical protein
MFWNSSGHIAFQNILEHAGAKHFEYRDQYGHDYQIFNYDDVLKYCHNGHDLFDLMYQNKLPFKSASSNQEYRALQNPTSIVSMEYINCMELTILVQSFCENKGIKYAVELIEMLPKAIEDFGKFWIMYRKTHIYPFIYEDRTWYFFNYSNDSGHYEYRNVGRYLDSGLKYTMKFFKDQYAKGSGIDRLMIAYFGEVLNDHDKKVLEYYGKSNMDAQHCDIYDHLNALDIITKREREYFKRPLSKRYLIAPKENKIDLEEELRKPRTLLGTPFPFNPKDK